MDFFGNLQRILKEEPGFAFFHLSGMANFPVLIAGIVSLLFDKFWLAVGLICIAFCLSGWFALAMWPYSLHLYLPCLVLAAIGIMIARRVTRKTSKQRVLFIILELLIFAPIPFFSFGLASCSESAIACWQCGM